MVTVAAKKRNRQLLNIPAQSRLTGWPSGLGWRRTPSPSAKSALGQLRGEKKRRYSNPTGGEES